MKRDENGESGNDARPKEAPNRMAHFDAKRPALNCLPSRSRRVQVRSCLPLVLSWGLAPRLLCCPGSHLQRVRVTAGVARGMLHLCSTSVRPLAIALSSARLTASSAHSARRPSSLSASSLPPPLHSAPASSCPPSPAILSTQFSAAVSSALPRRLICAANAYIGPVRGETFSSLLPRPRPRCAPSRL